MLLVVSYAFAEAHNTSTSREDSQDIITRLLETSYLQAMTLCTHRTDKYLSQVWRGALLERAAIKSRFRFQHLAIFHSK